jgi:DNA repair exonuclease SbcCD ATPase subunit
MLGLARQEGASVTILEETFDEIEQLEVQHEEALVQLREAERELEELNELRIELAPAAFTGDKVADNNLMVLESEASKLTRGARLARNAAKEFERRLETARKRRVEERRRLARERFEELAVERYELGVEAEKAMSMLLGVLERYEPIHSEQDACARGFEEDSRTKNLPRSLIRAWLVSRFREYLGVSSIDHLDRPLSEADDLAAKPKDEG